MQCRIYGESRGEWGRGKPSKEVFPKEQAGKEMKEKRKKKSINKEANVPLASAAQSTVTYCCAV